MNSLSFIASIPGHYLASLSCQSSQGDLIISPGTSQIRSRLSNVHGRATPHGEKDAIYKLKYTYDKVHISSFCLVSVERRGGEAVYNRVVLVCLIRDYFVALIIPAYAVNGGGNK